MERRTNEIVTYKTDDEIKFTLPVALYPSVDGVPLILLPLPLPLLLLQKQKFTSIALLLFFFPALYLQAGPGVDSGYGAGALFSGKYPLHHVPCRLWEFLLVVSHLSPSQYVATAEVPFSFEPVFLLGSFHPMMITPSLPSYT